MAEFASKGVAGAGLGTGIAGLSLGVLNALGNNGGLLGVLGGGGGNYVSRTELGMAQELAAKDAKIGLLESNIYTDQKIVDSYIAVMGKVDALAAEVRGNKDAQAAINLEQAVLNGTTGTAISCIQERVADLRAVIGGITKTVVPNSAICPGYGDVTVTITPTTTTPTT